MIQLSSHEQCTGCSACQQKCPYGAISMSQDREGFVYPEIDTTKCVNCHLCERTCPILNVTKKNSPIKIYVARCIEENKVSSSGGIFSLIAKKVIAKKGVVFGARFDENYNVIHDYAESESDLLQFCGTKYVQSFIGNSFKQVQEFLANGRLVLFSGTPCQIAGLKSFLKIDYDNLLTLDLFCKGVPSNKIWHQYLNELTRENDISISDIKSINFRDKVSGWKSYSFSLTTAFKKIVISKNENEYLQGFFANLYNRVSCQNCTLKCDYLSDFRLGDAWGFDFMISQRDEKQGASLLMINTLKAQAFFDGLDAEITEVKIDDVIRNNPACIHSFSSHKNRDIFLSANHQCLRKDIRKAIKRPLVNKILNRIKKLIRL